MKNIAIVGMGKSGLAVFKYLKTKLKLTNLLCVDSSQKKLNDIQSMFNVATALDSEPFPKGIKMCIKSPGIKINHPWILSAIERKIPIKTEMELAFEELIKQNKVMLGITGTNGKTTTTLFLCHLLETVGVSALPLGNIGNPLLDYLSFKEEVAVIEISSFQLETIKKPREYLFAGACLNFSINHLDHHENLKSYKNAKERISFFIKKNGVLYLPDEEMDFSTFPLNRDFFLKNSAKYEFLLKSKGINFYKHDLKNFMAAFCLASSIKEIPDESFIKAVRTFQKPAHRLEFVTEIGGVSYYNDSKATSLDAVLQAVHALKRNIIIILGGVWKGGDFSFLASSFFNKVKLILAIGKAAKKISKDFAGLYNVSIFSSLQNAVDYAFSIAEVGDSVLLSPGCSSFDYFENYEHRGDCFKSMINKKKEIVL